MFPTRTPKAIWLMGLADPAGPRRPLPQRRLALADLCWLWQTADAHSVLPAVVQNVRCLGERAIQIARRDELDAPLARATAVVLRRIALSMGLTQHAEHLAADLAAKGLRFTILKGPAFAGRLYQQPGLRTFIDIDLLVPQADWAATAKALVELGYRTQDRRVERGYSEQGWHHPHRPGLLELHYNLVNSPVLRRGISVGFDDLAFDPADVEFGGRVSADSMLLVAAVHGAASHGFDKLQHVTDVCQAARGMAGEIDESRLAETARRTGSTLALAMALDLAGRIFDEPRCFALLERFGLRWPRRLARSLLTPGTIVQAQGTRRGLSSWRRQTFRELLKFPRIRV